MLPAATKETKPSSSLVADQICQRFSLDEIRSATQNFNGWLVIGRGGFGKVYKGEIQNGSDTVVAIKRLHSMSNQGAPEFRAEVEMLSKLRHCNLVSLIGYCNDGAEMVLVYDYMPQGTLEDRLHRDDTPLSWLQRLKICLGAARGLDYLHTGTGTQHGVIHRDVKSSNVLLDENFAAKISDFGLAKIGPTNQTRTYVSTGVKGTFGYMDPGYFFSGKLTRKSDVYSFGVVLLEVMCGRPAVDTSLDEEQWGLAPWAQDRIKKGKLNQIVDSRLKGQISSNCLKDFARIACHCLHNQPNQRPTMAEIIGRLEQILLSQERLDSSVTEGKFIDKLWSFFWAKAQSNSNNSSVTEGEPSNIAGDKVNNATVTTRTDKVDSGHKDALQLIHFDASSYTYEDLRGAHAELLGKTSYWTAYRASLRDGNQLVVRRMKKGSFWDENIVLGKVRSLGKLCHQQILAPKAYYYSKDETLYITDYIRNGSLASLLHSSSKPIGWSSRMSIIVGIARGLVYLHTRENIVHGYLTSVNVLLDENCNPLITDVGLTRLTDDMKQNYPLNHAPELLKFQDANMKTDVYALGLIILEILTRKSTRSKRHGINFPGWVMSIPLEESRDEVFDPELKKEKSNINQELIRMLELATACVSLSPNARPEAKVVLQQLEEICGHRAKSKRNDDELTRV